MSSKKQTRLMYRYAQFGTLLACLTILAGCHGIRGDSSSSPAPTYSLNATVSGLASSGLVLLVNSTAVNVPVGASTPELAGSLDSGSAYSVSVQTQPVGETCTVANGSGTIHSANMSNVAVTCSPNTYAVGGTISGLTAGGLTLLNNGADATPISANATQFTLTTAVAYGSAYAITVQAAPAGFTCAVSNGTGTVGTTPVTNVAVTCMPNTYTVGGTISGLISSGLVLANGSDTLAVNSGASSFALPTAVAYASAYAVTIQTQPAGLACAVGNGTGTMAAAAVTNVTITCTPNTYTVGGMISGLSIGSVTLLDNGGDALQVSATQFTMHTPIAYGDPYSITVQTAPADLVCYVTNGSDTMGAGNVTNVSVACMSNFTLLYSFAGGSDGASPYHSLIQATDGNFYGTTLKGGTSSDGTVFKIMPSGTETVLYSFPKSAPYSGLTQGSDGNFYGTTQNEGANNAGTIFELTPGGTETDLYSFPAGSSEPYTGVIEDSTGNFYGTTSYNGTSDHGTVFEFTPGGTETVLHTFPKVSNGDGYYPYAGLIQVRDGNFYGTTYNGGANSYGTVFKITPTGTESVLYSFAGGSDGANPYADVIQGSDGNFYGTTYAGGANGLGTVFELTPGGTETILYSFSGTDGANPDAGLTEGRDGNFYGATYSGGANGDGAVFKITPGGVETVLHSFDGSDGANPWANLVLGSDGNLYGTTYKAGASGDGTFFKITPQ